MTMFVKVGYFFAVPMLIFASIAAAWERYQRNFASRPIAVLEVVIVASVCGTTRGCPYTNTWSGSRDCTKPVLADDTRAWT